MLNFFKKITTIPLLMLFYTIIHAYCPQDLASTDWNQAFKDIELAARLGSGEHINIDLNATSGLEGECARVLRSMLPPPQPKPTLLQKIKVFLGLAH